MIPTEVWIAAGYGLLLGLAALARYLTRPREAAKADPVLTGVGLGYVEREQMERLIAEVKRIADAITDKNTSSINDRLDELVDKLDGIKTVPPRRR